MAAMDELGRRVPSSVLVALCALSLQPLSSQSLTSHVVPPAGGDSGPGSAPSVTDHGIEVTPCPSTYLNWIELSSRTADKAIVTLPTSDVCNATTYLLSSGHCPCFCFFFKAQFLKRIALSFAVHFALTVVGWMKNKDNKRVLYVFRRAPPRSPEREVGGRSFLREFRDQRENAPPSSPPHVFYSVWLLC